MSRGGLLFKLTSVGRAVAGVVRAPTRGENVHRLEASLVALASDAMRARIIARYRRAPDIGVLLAALRLPPLHDLDALGACPRGSLGEAYRRFMTEHGLSVDDYGEPAPEARDEVEYAQGRPADELLFFRPRMRQTHDCYHVLLDIRPDIAGELEVVGFLLAQLDRAMGGNGLTVVFVQLIAGAFLGHILAVSPLRLGGALGRLRAGWRRGRAARLLFSVRWEELWDQPLAALRAAYLGGDGVSAGHE